MELLAVLKQIDWILAGILLIGGRYWAGTYFKKVIKNRDISFLVFATFFGAIWILIQKYTGTFSKDQVGNIFITYLFTTSFYQLLAKRLFEAVENLPWLKKVTTKTDTPDKDN